MIPDYKSNTVFSFSNMPSKTYGIDFEKRRIGKTIDGIEALRQAIYKIIATEKFEHIIYSDNYGVELKNLFGKSKYFVYSEIERRIKEALLNDSRIKAIYDFSFSEKKGAICLKFSADTIFGKTDVESVVS